MYALWLVMSVLTAECFVKVLHGLQYQTQNAERRKNDFTFSELGKNKIRQSPE
jgi:hypothetical protein